MAIAPSITTPARQSVRDGRPDRNPHCGSSGKGAFELLMAKKRYKHLGAPHQQVGRQRHQQPSDLDSGAHAVRCSMRLQESGTQALKDSRTSVIYFIVIF